MLPGFHSMVPKHQARALNRRKKKKKKKKKWPCAERRRRQRMDGRSAPACRDL
jgi:hypothetical protein